MGRQGPKLRDLLVFGICWLAAWMVAVFDAGKLMGWRNKVTIAEKGIARD